MPKNAAKTLLVFTLGMAMSACSQMGPKKSEPLTSPSQPVVKSEENKVEEPVAAKVERRQPPKLGIILGAAGLRSYAYIGVLRELERARIPIHAMVGLEWGALVAGLYAVKGQSNDLEWQMLKLKKSDVFQSSIFSKDNSANSTEQLDGFLSKTLGEVRFEGLNVSMSCPVRKGARVDWLERGNVANALKMCMSFPPLLKAPSNAYSAAYDLDHAVKHLKEKGAEVIVFINGIEAGPIWSRDEATKYFEEEIIWRHLKSRYKSAEGEVDEVFGLYVDSTVRDFEKRRQAIRKGQNAGRNIADRLTTKYNY